MNPSIQHPIYKPALKALDIDLNKSDESTKEPLSFIILMKS
jgi:hypothetical protein